MIKGFSGATVLAFLEGIEEDGRILGLQFVKIFTSSFVFHGNRRDDWSSRFTLQGLPGLLGVNLQGKEVKLAGGIEDFFDGLVHENADASRRGRGRIPQFFREDFCLLKGEAAGAFFRQDQAEEIRAKPKGQAGIVEFRQAANFYQGA